MHYRTIVISDTHLGTKDAKSKELSNFLKNNSCEKLILNGDIIDIWHLRRGGKWRKKDTRIFRRILKMMEDFDTQVYYVRGNHDELLEQILPTSLGNFHIVKELTHLSNSKKYWVVHGDFFDVVSNKFKWIAHLGDLGYKFLLWLNRRHNKYRKLRGLPYYSLSQEIKHKVKMAVSFIGDFEMIMVEFAKQKKMDGIICGHIHQPANKTIQGIHYLNSGDWVETLSALVEDFEHNWEIVYYDTLIPAYTAQEANEDN